MEEDNKETAPVLDNISNETGENIEKHKTPNSVWIALGGVVILLIVAAILFIPTFMNSSEKKTNNTSSDGSKPAAIEDGDDNKDKNEQDDYTLIGKDESESFTLVQKTEKISFDDGKLVIVLEGEPDEDVPEGTSEEFFIYSVKSIVVNGKEVAGASDLFGDSVRSSNTSSEFTVDKIGGVYIIKAANTVVFKDRFVVLNKDAEILEQSTGYYFGGENDSFVYLSINDKRDGFTIEVYGDMSGDTPAIDTVEYKIENGSIKKVE